MSGTKKPSNIRKDVLFHLLSAAQINCDSSKETEILAESLHIYVSSYLRAMPLPVPNNWDKYSNGQDWDEFVAKNILLNESAAGAHRLGRAISL